MPAGLMAFYVYESFTASRYLRLTDAHPKNTGKIAKKWLNSAILSHVEISSKDYPEKVSGWKTKHKRSNLKKIIFPESESS